MKAKIKQATWAELLGAGATKRVKKHLKCNPLPSDRTIHRVLTGISPDKYGIYTVASVLYEQQKELDKKLALEFKKITTKTK